MIINNKKVFKSITHNNKYIIINEAENKIYTTDKENIKKELFKEISNKYKDTGKINKEFKEREKTLWFDIETVIVEYNPENPSELYEKGGFYYYNLFKNTNTRKRMLEIYEKHKQQNKLININEFIEIMKKKYKHVNLLFDSLTNFNEKYKKYVLNWLAYVFITHKKTQNTIIFKGIEGTGKGLLYDYIISKVFYKNQTTIISNDELNNSFNEFLENKSFIIANEVQDYTNKKSVYEKLKQWITDTTILLNVKHVNMRNITNYANFLIYSNNDNPIPITATDRRYSVINTIDKKLEILTKEILNIDIIEFVENLNKEAELFLYELSKLNFSQKEARKLLQTEEREQIILNTEEKTKILKDKLRKLDKEFFLVKYPAEYLFDIDEESYFKITEKLKLGNVNNNIEETHKHIMMEIFEAIETKNFIPIPYLKYLLYFMYMEQKELKELNKYIGKIGKKENKTKWFKNKGFKVVEIKPISINNNNYNINNDENNKELEQLKRENEELKKEIEKLKAKLFEKNNKILKLEAEVNTLLKYAPDDYITF